MKYQALYRKYRPNQFNKVIGQDHIVTSLKNSIINNKINHAYLLCGPRGVGKTSIAKIFAKTVNCLQFQNGEACNICDICQAFNTNSSIDLLEIDGASNNGVDEIRDLKEKINLLPAQSRYKVYIIDEVHMLTISAFNALLKTLEEPPKHVIFILATTEVFKVPATIISRCQKFDFKLVNKKDLIQNLATVLKSEAIAYDNAALEQIAILSLGAVRDSLTLLEQIIAYDANAINLKTIHTLFNIPSKAKKLQFLLALINNQHPEALKMMTFFFDSGTNINTLIMDLINICKEIIIFKTTNNHTLLTTLDQSDCEKFHSLDKVHLLQIVDDYIAVLNNYHFINAAEMYFEIASFKIMNYFQNINIDLNIDIDNLEKMPLNHNEAPVLIETEKMVLTPQVDNADTTTIIDSQESTETMIISQENDDFEVKTISSQISDEPFQWEMKDYFNIFIKADKYFRTEYSNSWKNLNQYLNDPQFHNFAKLLVNTVIVAAIKNAIILGCDLEQQTKVINKMAFTKKMQAFFQELLKVPNIVVIALQRSQLPLIRKEYNNLRIANKLPEQYEVKFDNYQHLVEENTESEIDNSIYQTVQSLFENITVVN